MNTTQSLLLLAALATSACQSPPPAPTGVQTFGTMREVMRDGQMEGRVSLQKFSGTKTIGVGALAQLGGEITIVDGQVLVSTVQDGIAVVRLARPEDQATLLVTADIGQWHHFEIGSCKSYEALEQRLAELLRARGRDLTKPTPVRITGKARRLQVHVINGACPIAQPTGPKPWRYDGPADNVRLVGFYVEDSAGRLTHHTHSSHLHAVSDQAMGHLDEISLSNAIVSLPAPTRKN
ncbi:MAG: alpha-acetolactate decarboxylase [Planctomycetota bacterium]|jgi:alpha-acetolactate decarboxylase